MINFKFEAWQCHYDCLFVASLAMLSCLAMLLVHCHLIISRVGKIATAWARLVHRGTNRQVFDGEAPLGNDLHSSDNFPFGI